MWERMNSGEDWLGEIERVLTHVIARDREIRREEEEHRGHDHVDDSQL
jgi:hypothetical protein